jgi:hypothetical protein
MQKPKEIENGAQPTLVLDELTTKTFIFDTITELRKAIADKVEALNVTTMDGVNLSLSIASNLEAQMLVVALDFTLRSSKAYNSREHWKKCAYKLLSQADDILKSSVYELIDERFANKKAQSDAH